MAPSLTDQPMWSQCRCVNRTSVMSSGRILVRRQTVQHLATLVRALPIPHQSRAGTHTRVDQDHPVIRSLHQEAAQVEAQHAVGFQEPLVGCPLLGRGAAIKQRCRRAHHAVVQGLGNQVSDLHACSIG